MDRFACPITQKSTNVPQITIKTLGIAKLSNQCCNSYGETCRGVIKVQIIINIIMNY